MLTLYFSGTGNTEWLARRFAQAMQSPCHSIEEQLDYPALLAQHDTICVAYPIYGSRVPMMMREFAQQHSEHLAGKQLVILVTQLIFSGDGARAFMDFFPKGHARAIYAEHFLMPNNVCNFALLRKTSAKKTARQLRRAEQKIKRIAADLQAGRVRLRGFSTWAKFWGAFQGNAWPAMEAKAMRSVKISADCVQCGLCVKVCPMTNLSLEDNMIVQHERCTVCYRCINLCPKQAITCFFHRKPQWQYEGLGKE